MTLKEKITYSLPLVFVASMLPDLDFFFLPTFPHHTITHSVTFWSAIYLPLLAIFRLKVIPYLVATFSHFLIGDIVTGNPPLFYGISDQQFALARPWIAQHYGESTGVMFQTVIDLVMIIAFVAYAFVKKSIPSFFTSSYDLKHIMILIAVVFVIFFGAYKNDIVYLLQRSSESQQEILYIGLGVLALSHAAFLATMIVGTKRPALPKHQTKPYVSSADA